MNDRFIDCRDCGMRFERSTVGSAVICPMCGGTLGADPRSDLSARLDWATCQEELARLERDWEAERAGCLVRTRQGALVVPTVPGSIAAGVAIGGVGVFWVFAVLEMANRAAPADAGAYLFALLGVLAILYGVGSSIYSYRKAVAYERGFARYHERRAALLIRLDEPSPPLT